MSVHIRRVRIVTKTNSHWWAGTNDGLFLVFEVPDNPYTTYPAKGWTNVELDNPGDDREPRKIDVYDVDFATSSISKAVSGTRVPDGIAYSDMNPARNARFRFRHQGTDAWSVDYFYMLGRFFELNHEGGTIDSHSVVDLGWRLMAYRDNDFTMSDDDSEGVWKHDIILNGPF